MQIAGISAYLVIEALVIALIGMLTVLWLYQRDKNRHRHHQAAANDTRPALPYRLSLEQQIHATEARLAELNADRGAANIQKDTVATRLQYLRAEYAVSDAADDDSYWERLGAGLKPLIRSSRKPAETGDQAQDRLIRALRIRITAFETRVANLEQFKTLFFELKQQHAETMHLSRELHSAVEKSLPGTEQSPELQAALQRMREENARLEGQIAYVEQELDNIMLNVRALSVAPGPGAGVAGSAETIDDGMRKIRHVIGNQEQQIRELHTMIAGLELEVEEKNRLQRAIDDVNAKHAQISGVVEILEEENTFLQQQISALLTQELEHERMSCRTARTR